MAIAISVQDYLESCSAQYDLLPHPKTSSAMASARTANINAHQLAKGVVLKDVDNNYLMAVIPADNRLSVGALSFMLDRDLSLVHEWELDDIFPDCESGAVPCLGQAYGMDIVWDEQLSQSRDVYFESGDHRQLVHLDQREFHNIMEPFLHDDISVSIAEIA